MIDSVYLFEDDGWRDLLPFTYLRPVSGLRCGCFTLEERIERVLGVKVSGVLARDYLSPVSTIIRTKELIEDVIYINGRLIKFSKDEILNLGRGEMLLSEEEVVAFRPAGNQKIEIPLTSEFLKAQRGNYKIIESDAKLIKYPWNLVEANRAMLIYDFSLLNGEVMGFVDSGVKIFGNPKDLFLGENSRIESFSILYLDGGPIYIGKDVKIKGFTTIEGPCYIGDRSVVEGGKLTNSSFGPECRLGGEIEASIFQGYSNKRHEGFLGHSVVGEWVNLGAGTTNSDLKNNYKEVRVQLGTEQKSTGILKLGCFIGDHTKTGIGTLITTGAVFGVFCNLLGGKPSPKYLPSFSWDTGDKFTEYEIDKAIETARIVMERRGIELNPQIEGVFRKIFELTKPERSNWFG